MPQASSISTFPSTSSAASTLPELAPRPDATIRIVGLGLGALDDLTLGAWQALHAAPRLILRTSRHPTIEHLAPTVQPITCDDLYEQHDDFADVYAAIAERVLTAAEQPGGVVYAVPGHPWVGEATTRLILDQAQSRGLTVDIIGGMSFIESSFAAVAIDPMDGSQVIDAMLLAQQHHPRLDVGLPLLVAQLYAGWLASDVKLTLMNAYPDEHPVTLIHGAGTPQARTVACALHALDHQAGLDHLTSLYVPPLERGSFTDLQEIISRLRAPEGCPWDQEQTLESLRQDLLGECVEVLEAIDAESATAESTDEEIDNSEHIAEELGDLYLVATMLVQIATEEGRFHMADVMREIVTKLIRRHPHVFGDVDTDNVDQIVKNWDQIKAEEKAAKGQRTDDPLAGVPTHLPALEKARQLQKKAHKAGLLDRAAIAQDNVQDSVHLAALLAADPSAARLGQLLWQLVALAHVHDLNAEDALRAHAVAFHRAHAR